MLVGTGTTRTGAPGRQVKRGEGPGPADRQRRHRSCGERRWQQRQAAEHGHCQRKAGSPASFGQPPARCVDSEGKQCRGHAVGDDREPVRQHRREQLVLLEPVPGQVHRGTRDSADQRMPAEGEDHEHGQRQRGRPRGGLAPADNCRQRQNDDQRPAQERQVLGAAALVLRRGGRRPRGMEQQVRGGRDEVGRVVHVVVRRKQRAVLHQAPAELRPQRVTGDTERDDRGHEQTASRRPGSTRGGRRPERGEPDHEQDAR